MKTSRTLVKILSLALVFAMMFTLVSCNLFGGSLKLESFTVDRSSVKTSYYIGEEIDFSGIKAVAKYSDSSLDKEYTAADLTVTYDPDITATVGQKEVKVSFQDPNLNCEQSTTVAITVSEDPNLVKHESYKIDATNVKTNYNVGETVDLTGLKLYDVMNNRSEVEITDLTGLVFTPALDTVTAAAGNVTVTATYNGEAVTGNIVFRVVDPEAVDPLINAVPGGSYKTNYEVGDTALDLTGLTVTLTYKESGTVTLDTGFTAEGVDFTTAQNGISVKVNFTDPVHGNSEFVYITINIVKRDEVMQFAAPSGITAFNSDNASAGTLAFGDAGFAGQFAVGGQIYKIGDDNEFTMLPILTIRDTDGLPSEALTRYNSVVDLYVDFGEGYVLLDKTANTQTNYTYSKDGVTYATVDTYNGVYKFDRPISKVKISVLPSSEYFKGANAGNPVVLEAEVIDAYNVTKAYELGLVEYNFEGDRRAMWDSFKLANGLATVNDEGVVEHLFVNGIVLHNDLELTADDVPQDYFYVSTKDVRYFKTVNGVTEEKIYPAGTRYLKFRKHIFSHDNTDFVIEGNFFTIDVSTFPTVATPTVVNDDKISAGASENSLFQFHNVWEVTGPEATINNVMFIGNAARDNWVADNGSEESTELLSAGGIQLVRAIENGVVNCNNILSNSCFINYMADWHGVINVKNSKTYDAFQNAVFVSRNSVFNAEDSYFVGTGGPVIIAQSEHIDGTEYKACTTNITNCVLDTHLVGDELWFKSLGASAEVAKISALGLGVQQIVAALSQNQVNVTWVKDGKMNIQALMMRSGGIEGMADGLVKGSLTIDGVGRNRDYNPLLLVGQAAPSTAWENILISPAYQGGKQILTVYDAQGGAHTVYFDQSQSMLFDMSGTALYASAEAQGFFAAIATAEVLFLDYGGLTIALELYH